MSSFRYDVANPRIDQLGPSERLEPEAPLVAAYLGGRPVVLARPEQRGEAYPDQRTVPISISRLRRAIDIEAERATGPYAPSLVDDFPLTHVPMVYEMAGESAMRTGPSLLWPAALALAASGVGALAYPRKPLLGAMIGAGALAAVVGIGIVTGKLVTPS
jgi:hypothetical protein